MGNFNDSFLAMNTIQYESDYTFQIQNTFMSMSKTYQKIARYIIENPESVAQYTISQLAAKIGTCASSITRFCQSLGYNGYPQFKFAAKLEKLYLIQNIKT